MYKKTKYKRNYIILLCICLNMLLIGCNNGTKSNEKEPITFTFFFGDLNSKMKFNDDIAKKITEITGVTLKIIHQLPEDSQAVELMIASGEYPDLIYSKEETNKLIDTGAIIRLDDYINNKGKNLKKLYGDQIDRLKISKDNPHIYTVGTYGMNEEMVNTSGTVQIQHKALEATGYPKLKNIYDFEKVIKDYIKLSPKTDDGQDRIGLSLMASDWRWIITCGNIASAVIGIPDDGQYYVDDKTGKSIYKFTIPEIKEYFKWLNHMNDIGLLDPESFTQSEEVYKSKISSGRVVALTDKIWNYSDAEDILIDSGREDEAYARFPLVIDELKYSDQTLKDYGFRGGWGISISKTCKDKDRAFEFLDWMASEEAQVLVNWGIEGVHYFYDENGRRKFYNEDKTARKDIEGDYTKEGDSGVGFYVYPFPQRTNGEIDSTGNPYLYINEEIIKSSYTKAEKKTLVAYGVESWAELCTPTEELPISKHGQAWQYNLPLESEAPKIQKQLDDYFKCAIAEAILGKPEDFDMAWEQIQMRLKELGVEKLNNEITKFTKERIELWNK